LSYYNGNQSTLWNNRTDGSRGTLYNGWGARIDEDQVKYNEAFEKMQKAKESFQEGTLSEKKLKKAEKKWEKFEDEYYGVI
jgi:hypothetical protein